MRVCPKCGYRDPPYWRPAKMHNPSGDMDIARIDDLQMWQPKIAEKLLAKRGEPITNSHFAYLIGKRAVWVKRIAIDVFRDCGRAAFKPAFETSRHNKLAAQVSGRTRTTFGRRLDNT